MCAAMCSEIKMRQLAQNKNAATYSEIKKTYVGLVFTAMLLKIFETYQITVLYIVSYLVSYIVSYIILLYIKEGLN